MPENELLNGYLDEINVEFVEREATPRLLMKLSIQLHLAGLSISNTVSIHEIFGVERARSTVHNWVHKADLQPESGRCPDHVAVAETVIQLNNEQYWLYAVLRTLCVLMGCENRNRFSNAVDLKTNELLHTKLEPTTTKALAHSFLTELSEKYGNRNAVECVFREIKRRTLCFSNCFSNAEAETADDWLRSFSFAWNQLI